MGFHETSVESQSPFIVWVTSIMATRRIISKYTYYQIAQAKCMPWMLSQGLEDIEKPFKIRSNLYNESITVTCIWPMLKQIHGSATFMFLNKLRMTTKQTLSHLAAHELVYEMPTKIMSHGQLHMRCSVHIIVFHFLRGVRVSNKTLELVKA
jgi:hypothetical protein